MIRYDSALSKLMDERQYTANENGLNILIKPVPDGEPGRLDPREARMLAKMSKFRFLGAGDDINVSRRMMGFPNLNMNTKEIYTKYIEVLSGGRSVPVWVYWPRRPEGKKDRAGFIYLHGGGWSGGTAFATENICRLLAEKADCVVFNVEYALAPENPYPAALEDCRAVLQHVFEHAESYGADKRKICIGGDSAGGNLAASTAMWDRDIGTHMLSYQALIYPAVNLARNISENDRDVDIAENERKLIEPLMGLGRDDDMANIYVGPDGKKDDPYVSPALGAKKGLCRALIATAEYDSLRVQGEEYAGELIEAGVAVKLIRYRGVCHMFIDKLGYLPQTENLISEIAGDMTMYFENSRA